VDALRDDPRLAGLRPHPDFAKLIERAEKMGREASLALSAEMVPPSDRKLPK
jgi:hypothetical protein